jgi:hypothetical protein
MISTLWAEGLAGSPSRCMIKLPCGSWRTIRGKLGVTSWPWIAKLFSSRTGFVTSARNRSEPAKSSSISSTLEAPRAISSALISA